MANSQTTVQQTLTGSNNIFAGAGDVHVNVIHDRLPPAEAQYRADLRRLLSKVQSFWIEGVLEKSAHSAVLLDLGKQIQSEAVEHPWEEVLELPNTVSQTLPRDTKISTLFDQYDRALLILGEPGSGKTITLLELARELIIRTKNDSELGQPIPVIFNLSTWASQHRPLVDWLVEELTAKYQIPKRLGRPWLETNRLLLLLDGLDEVKSEYRPACVEAINAFGGAYGLAGLVVCCRLEEYSRMSVRLKLNAAVCLQPLTQEHVYEYLLEAGPKLAALQATLPEDEALRTLAQSPLMLSIMSLAYKDVPVEGPVHSDSGTLDERRRRLFDTYMDRMFKRRGQGSKPYSAKQTKVWLALLAQKMIQHKQTIFLIEQLQPSWLPTRKWRWVYLLGSRLIGGLIAGLLVGLLLGQILILLETPIFRLYPSQFAGQVSGIGIIEAGIWGMLIVGAIGGLIGGLSFGLIDALRFDRSGVGMVAREPAPWKERFDIIGVALIGWLIVAPIAGLIYGLSLGLTYGLMYGLIAWLIAGLIGGLSYGLILGLIRALGGNRRDLANDIRTVEALSWSWRRARKGGIIGLVGSVIFALGIGLIYVIALTAIALISKAGGLDTLFLGPIIGASTGLLCALTLGIPLGLIGILLGGLNSRTIEMKIAPNQGIRLSEINALSTVLIIGLIFGPPGGLVYGLLYGPIFGLLGGLLFGLNAGLLFALSYGGLVVIRHFTLRFILWRQGYVPWNYARFLDYAAECILLRKVGGGYIFIHRLLMEYLAA